MSRRRFILTALGGVALLGCTTPSASPTARPTGTPAESAPASAAATVVDDTIVRPGDEWIAYQADSGSGDGIFLVRPDGTGKHQLLSDMAGEEIHPDWSPDGEQIAFVHFDPSDISELWIVNADGTGEEMLYRCELPCNSMDYPDWAPDGSAVYTAITANADENGYPATFGVARVDPGSDEATWVLTREDGMTAEQPRISPDGTQVVFTRYDTREDRDLPPGSAIFISDLVGGPEQRLTEWDMWAAHPDWSTDNGIVFNTFDLGVFQTDWWATNVYTMGTDGSSLTPLTEFGEGETRATQPRWVPDGSGITFTQVDGGEGFGTRQLAFMAADGSGRRFLTADPTAGTHPQLRPLP